MRSHHGQYETTAAGKLVDKDFGSDEIRSQTPAHCSGDCCDGNGKLAGILVHHQVVRILLYDVAE